MSNAPSLIQNAIDKLTWQRDQAIAGPWRHVALNHWGTPTPGIWADGDDQEVGYPFEQPDADLLVTLHATIDAQLDLLRKTLQFVESTPGATSHEGPVVDLALAILGQQATND
jgi:hypothetical protein